MTEQTFKLMAASGAVFVKDMGLVLVGRATEAGILLEVELARLIGKSMPSADVSLPGGCAYVLDAIGIGEDVVDLFECLASRFGEHEEHMHEHGGAEDAEDDVGLPLDVLEGWWNKVAKSEVESPVGGGCKRDSLATYAKRVEFRWVDPRDWAPRWCV